MSADASAFASFEQKWFAAHPEHEIASAFLPRARRRAENAFGCLVYEIDEVAAQIAEPQVAAAKQAVAKAKADVDAAAKAFTAAGLASKTATDRLAKLDADAKSASQAIDAARVQRTRLDASANKRTASTQPAKASAN